MKFYFHFCHHIDLSSHQCMTFAGQCVILFSSTTIQWTTWTNLPIGSNNLFVVHQSGIDFIHPIPKIWITNAVKFEWFIQNWRWMLLGMHVKRNYVEWSACWILHTNDYGGECKLWQSIFDLLISIKVNNKPRIIMDKPLTNQFSTATFVSNSDVYGTFHRMNNGNFIWKDFIPVSHSRYSDSQTIHFILISFFSKLNLSIIAVVVVVLFPFIPNDFSDKTKKKKK